MQRPTSLAGRGSVPVAIALALICCESPGPAPERAAAQPPVPAPSTPARATRVVTPPALSPFTPSMVARLRAIRATNEGRHDDVFMKVGDSSTVSRGFLQCLSDDDEVELGAHEALAATLAHFRGGRAGRRDPFRRESLAAAEGWSARHVLSGRPPPILRELRATRPRFALVMNGGNDVEAEDDHRYGRRLRQIAELLIAQGVIPVLSSVPPRDDDAAADRWVARYNQTSWAIAQALALPYLDYHQVMAALPRRGLAGDGVHPNILLEGGRGHACRFDERGLAYGHNARNLLALRALDLLRRTVVEGEPAPASAPAALDGDGSVARPYEVRAIPFAHARDTRRDGSASIDAYEGCDASQDESGRELVYRLTIERRQAIRVLAIPEGDADVDVHLLRGAPRGAACVARDDRELRATLDPGEWFVAIDTFAEDGVPRAGEVVVLLAPDPSASGTGGATERAPR